MSSTFVTIEPDAGRGSQKILVTTSANRQRKNVRAVLTATTSGGATAEMLINKGNKTFVEINGLSSTAPPVITDVDTIHPESETLYLYGTSNSNGLNLWYNKEESARTDHSHEIKKEQYISIIKPNGQLIERILVGVPFNEDYGLDGEYKFFFPVEIEDIGTLDHRKFVFFAGDLTGLSTDSFEIMQFATYPG